MILDAIEQTWTLTSDNFAADMQALRALYNLPELDVTATIIKRQRTEISLALGKAPPLLGIVAVGARTNAKDQGKRDTQVRVEWDYYAEGVETAAPLLAKQVELACEAVLLTVDRIAGSGLLVFGGGELPGDVSIELSEGIEEKGTDATGTRLYWRRALIGATVWDRDNVI